MSLIIEMDAHDRRQKIVDDFGPWTSYQIEEGPGGPKLRLNPVADLSAAFLRRIIVIIERFAGKPFNELSILDLGCMEGLFSIECALRGAQVTGIEGRVGNIVRAEYAREALGLKNLKFIHEDIRNFSAHHYGRFDVVLCLGLLYHLYVPDNFQLIDNLWASAGGLAIIDTHFAFQSFSKVRYKGKEYAGNECPEFGYDMTERTTFELSVRSAIGNEKSFWLSKAALLNYLKEVGFSEVYESLCPIGEPRQSDDRTTLIALNSEPNKLLSVPDDLSDLGQRLPERMPGTFIIHNNNRGRET